MALRTILLHAAPDSGFLDRLAFAVGLASQSGATLKAIYTLYPAGVPHVGRALSIYISGLVHEAREKEANLKAQFEQAITAAGITGTWQAVEGDVTSQLRDAVNFADVTVVSETPYGTVDDELAATLPEQLALACNGPVIVVPTGKSVPAAIRRVLVAWKPSREAGHAVRFALPVLACAETVEVLTISEDAVDIELSGEMLVAFLASHGANATHKHVEAASAPKAIVAEAAEFGADLIVLGAYSRSRLAEFILGGVTACMLANPPAALLVAH